FYARNPVEVSEEDALELLKSLHQRTVAGKLAVLGSRSSNNFEFLAEMDGLQILEMIKNETLTVKAVVLTQCDPQKRATRDAQLLEVVLSLKHDELLQFLRGTANEIRGAIFAKSPKELAAELEEELAQIPVPNREAYQTIERKILNRMKIMAGEGIINLIET